jgi:hypothetical protein
MEREEHPGFIQVAFLSEGRERGLFLTAKGTWLLLSGEVLLS